MILGTARTAPDRRLCGQPLLMSELPAASSGNFGVPLGKKHALDNNAEQSKGSEQRDSKVRTVNIQQVCATPITAVVTKKSAKVFSLSSCALVWKSY